MRTVARQPAGPAPAPSRPRPRPARRPAAHEEVPTPGADARRRFRNLDPYRVEREWVRYDGTAQRRLFRELRERFLDRYAVSQGWVLDLGSGPGRFLQRIGTGPVRRVALDLSSEMLHRVPTSGPGSGQRVRGDGLRPPFRPHAFHEVVVLGNPVGFSAEEADRLWEVAGGLLVPGGRLILEVVAGPGERSRYLTRLPASSLARLLHAPLRAIVPRIEREGFVPEPVRRAPSGSFRRFDPLALGHALTARGWTTQEVLTVAPLLGSAPDRLEAVAGDPVAWARLEELEELFGHRPERIRFGAAVLVAATV